MRDSKIGYIILHYQIIEETVECVESIKRVLAENDVIIIVDNFSPNGSGELLYKKYNAESNIEVLLNSENLGFAKGNNKGYIVAKKKYNCDFIVMLNNDTLLTQKDFRDRLLFAYEQYNFAVMGPKILQKDGSVSDMSPTIPVHTDIIRARIGQISNYIRYFLSMIDLDIRFSRLVDNRQNVNKNYSRSWQENVQLAGCCWIFSNEYISRFDGINPNTFMYLEEILLYLRVKKAGLKIIYNPNLEIIHLEEAATCDNFKGKAKKVRQFKYKCHMNSFKVLIKGLKDGGI